MSVKKDPRRGTWFFVVDVPAVGGKRQQLKQRGFKTKKLAEEAEAAVVAERARGTFVRPARVTLGSFLLDEWLPAKRAGLKPSTAVSYEQMIDAYVVPTLGPVALGNVDGAILNVLYVHLLSDGRTGVPSTRYSAAVEARSITEVGAERARDAASGVP